MHGLSHVVLVMLNMITDGVVFSWRKYSVNYKDIQTIANSDWLNDEVSL